MLKYVPRSEDDCAGVDSRAADPLRASSRLSAIVSGQKAGIPGSKHGHDTYGAYM